MRFQLLKLVFYQLFILTAKFAYAYANKTFFDDKVVKYLEVLHQYCRTNAIEPSVPQKKLHFIATADIYRIFLVCYKIQ